MNRCLTLVVALMFVPGCGILIPWLESLRGTTGSSELKRFESEEKLAEYFTEQITERNDSFFAWRGGALTPEPGGDFDDASASPDSPQSGDASSEGGAGPTDGNSGGEGADGGDDFSNTTIQEEGVDEADVVKTKHLKVSAP